MREGTEGWSTLPSSPERMRDELLRGGGVLSAKDIGVPRSSSVLERGHRCLRRVMLLSLRSDTASAYAVILPR
jgi:hypothetical protein